jgi:outer membrane protein
MGNKNIIIQAFLAVAVIVLYILHFTSKDNEIASADLKQDSLTTQIASGSIAYVNIDTLLNQYDLFFDMKKDMEGKQKKAESELMGRQRTYESSVGDFQNKVQKGLVTRSKAQEMEQELMTEQQRLLQLRDNLTMQLAEEEQVMNRQLINNIMEYLKEFNADNQYTYILSNAFGSNLLYADEALDITPDVIKGLNNKYNAEKDAQAKSKK